MYIKSQENTCIRNLKNSYLIIVNIDEAVRQQEASYGESGDCPESSQDQKRLLVPHLTADDTATSQQSASPQCQGQISFWVCCDNRIDFSRSGRGSVMYIVNTTVYQHHVDKQFLKRAEKYRPYYDNCKKIR